MSDLDWREAYLEHGEKSLILMPTIANRPRKANVKHSTIARTPHLKKVIEALKSDPAQLQSSIYVKHVMI